MIKLIVIAVCLSLCSTKHLLLPRPKQFTSGTAEMSFTECHLR